MTEATERAAAPDKNALDGGTRLLRTSLLEPPATRPVPGAPQAAGEGPRGPVQSLVPRPAVTPAATPRVAIRLEEIGKVYPNGKHALVDIDLVVPEGDFVFLVGPSGAGKSTLIKLLVHDEESTSGIIHVAGYDLSRLRGRDIPRLRRQIGIVFQDFRLLPRKTVRENVAFALEVTGTPRRRIRPAVDRLLALVGLTAQADQRPGQLSGGEMQRCAIARAMVNDPRLIIADEPTGNLDPLISWEIIQLLLRINELGTTVLMATHNAEVVTALRKRVVALESGRIVRDEVGGYHRDYV
jgi:cell division transport system ATP-binding protein